MGAARLLRGEPDRWSVANPGNRAARAELVGTLRAVAAPQLEGEGPLLDCGCGHGWLLEALAAVGVDARRLHGIELDAERAAAAARRAPGAAVVMGDVRRLPYPDATFAAVFHVVSLSSVGPTAAVREALGESRRVLAPGGVLVVYEPRLPNPFNRRTRRLRRDDFAAAGLAMSEVRTLTLLPPLGRRLGPLTARLHPPLSRLPALRSHRLLVHRALVP